MNWACLSAVVALLLVLLYAAVQRATVNSLEQLVGSIRVVDRRFSEYPDAEYSLTVQMRPASYAYLQELQRRLEAER